MLRRYKRKHRKVKLKRRVMNRREYTKPSEARRKEVLKAEYINQKQLEENP